MVNGFDCDLCTRSYATDSGLKQHRIIFHKVDGAINKKSVFLKRSHVNGNKDNLLPEHNILVSELVKYYLRYVNHYIRFNATL